MFLCLLLLSLLCGFPAVSAPSQADSSTLPESTIRSRLEILSRISHSVYEGSPKVKTLVDETAAALHNDPRLIDLVTKFALIGHDSSILSIAINAKDERAQDKAITFLLSSSKDLQGLQDSKVLPLLARNGSSNAIALLMPTLRKESQTKNERTKLIKLLCLKKQSASLLLERLKRETSSEDLEIAKIAARTMRQTPWSDVRMGFEALNPDVGLSPTETKISRITDLMTRVGDPSSGRAIFRSPEFSCVNCHVAEDFGKDIGPGLSEIGKKLGKDALYDAILNPSSGISFDYEGWNLTLNSGDELTGIVLSRTETHWTLKNLLGQIEEIPLSEVFEKQKMSTSLMPNGLGLLLGEEKLVDLVSYLSTLGK